MLYIMLYIVHMAPPTKYISRRLSYVDYQGVTKDLRTNQQLVTSRLYCDVIEQTVTPRAIRNMSKMYCGESVSIGKHWESTAKFRLWSRHVGAEALCRLAGWTVTFEVVDHQPITLIRFLLCVETKISGEGTLGTFWFSVPCCLISGSIANGEFISCGPLVFCDVAGLPASNPCSSSDLEAADRPLCQQISQCQLEAPSWSSTRAMGWSTASGVPPSGETIPAFQNDAKVLAD